MNRFSSRRPATLATLCIALAMLALGCDSRSKESVVASAHTPAQEEAAARQVNTAFRFEEGNEGFTAHNAGHSLIARLGSDGLHVRTAVEDTSPLSLRTVAFGRADKLTTLEASGIDPQLGSCADPKRRDVDGECLHRVELDHGALTEWWVNRPDGLEQGFDVESAPDGAGELVVQLAVEGADVALAADGRSVRFERGALPALSYAGLLVVDAGGKRLASRFEVLAGGLALRVDDRGARYPVRIDPVLSSTASLDVQGSGIGSMIAPAGDIWWRTHTTASHGTDLLVGIPSTGQVQVLSLEGSSYVTRTATKPSGSTAYGVGRMASAAGDYNCDGILDWAIAAPDTSAADTNSPGVVYVFPGSNADAASTATTWSTTNVVTLRGGNDDMEYGAALAFGDFNRDGCSDLVIGAPGDQSGKGYVEIQQGSTTGFNSSAYYSGTTSGARLGATLAVCDFDGLGGQALAVGMPAYNSNSGGYLYFENTGSGSFDLTPDYTYLGGAGSQTAAALAAVGDIKGDGRCGLAVGAPGNGGNIGQVAVYLRVPSVQSGSTGWFLSMQRVDGSASGDQLGASVAGVGDVNGDGLGDWAVGAPGKDVSGLTDAGQVTTYFGNATDVYSSEVRSGTSANQRFGQAVSGAGDFNNDGFTDLAVGYSNGVQLFYGSAGDSSLKAYQTTSIADYITVADIKPTESTNIGFAKSIDGAGDVNMDGYQDVLIGAPSANSGGGRFYIRYGASSSPLSTGAIINGSGSAALGTQVVGLGDITGDNTSDIAVTAPGDGAVYLFLGDNTVANWDYANTYSITGFSGGSLSVAAAGDVNGDGYRDIIVGWTAASSGAGVANVYYGGSNRSWFFPSPDWSLTGQAGANMGSSVAGLGDVNGDGYDDVAIGSSLYDSTTADVGGVAVYLGSATGLSTTAYFSASGSQANEGFGQFVARVGDVNGDGRPDLAVGSPSMFLNGAARGQAYVYLTTSSGFDSNPTVLTGSAATPNAGDQLGGFITGGDFNGDDISDVIVSSKSSSNSRHIYTGGTAGLVTTDTSRYRTWYKGTSAQQLPVVAVGDVNGDMLADFASAANGASGVVDYVTVISGTERPARRSPTAVYVPNNLQRNSGYYQVFFTPPTQGPMGRVSVGIGIESSQASGSRSGWAPAAFWYDNPYTYSPKRYFDLTSSNTFPARMETDTLYDGARNRMRMRVRYSIAETVVVPHGPWLYISRDQELQYTTTACSSSKHNDLLGGLCNVCATNYYGFNCTTFCTRSATCNSHGDCSSTGSCTCDSTYAGSSCQYSDAVTCGGHGTAKSDGTCTCTTGYAGSTCQYSDASTCGGVGTAQNDGTCLCQSGYAGPHCEYSDAITCNAHGTANANGTCTCSASYGGARCDVCGTNRYGYPTCTFCDAATTCNGHGACNASGACACDSAHTGTACDSCSPNHYNYPTCTLCDASTCNGFSCDASGACVCPAGYAGSACQYTDAGTCNGRGTAQADGSCVCSSSIYTGTRCESCAAGLAGSSCQYSDAVTCSGNGKAQFDGSCVCSSGYAGASCQYSDAVTCNGHGAAQADGSCACSAQYSGTSCNSCSANHYVYPTCVLCTASGTCNSHGTCASDGSCSCDSGAAGTNCQYTDAGTCNGHGTVAANGTCTCQALFTGTSCEKCIAGRAGPSCEYTDAVTCSGNGTAQNDGSCVCASGYAGTSCQYSASDTCHGHGSVANDGSCTCSAAYTSATCDTCAPNYYVYPGCTFCQASTTCNGNGTCTSTGSCTCGTGAAGDRCQYTDATTCNGHGTAQSDGSCSCRAEFLGTHCELCIAGRAGSDCQYTDATTCNGHGTAQSDGSCVCSGVWTGNRCQYSSDTTCSGHGTVAYQGTCTCDALHGGSACDQCSTDHYNYPGCSTVCNATSTCGGHGTCNSQGACTCETGAAGTNCQFTHATTCKGHGTPNDSGVCTCDTGFTGVDCSSCTADHYGASCDYCVAAETCHGHGKCAAGGGCTCDAGYAGATCDSCAPDNYAYPSCIPCTGDVTCRGHGTCQSNGTCSCDAGSGFSGSECQYSNAASCTSHGFVNTSGTCSCSANYKGTSCEACNDGYLSYPTCKYCVASISCNGHGSCDGVGNCVCGTGYAGQDCSYSRAVTCSGHGTPTDAGQCQCDTGYGGRQCQLSRATDCSAHGDPQEDGTCLCDSGFVGTHCNVDQATTCNGHGLVSIAGDGTVSCACAAGFTGARCDKCAPDHYEYPTCRRCDAGTCNPLDGQCLPTGGCKCKPGRIGSSCQFSDYDTCSGWGVARYDGTCQCNAGYAGRHCEWSDYFNCSSRGKVDDVGHCTCDKGFVGKRCDTCAPSYYREFDWGGNCVYCDDNVTCSGKGSCDKHGSCACQPGFAGPNCQYSNETTCSAHGTAQSDGSCVCSGHWGGRSCEKCAPGYSGPECATFCDDQITCGGHGRCGADYPTAPERCTCFDGSYVDKATDFPTDKWGKPWTCTLCPAGHSCRGWGSDAHPACGKGMYAPAGSSKCQACPKDTYNDQEAAAQCKPCTKPQNLDVCTAWTCDPKTGESIFTQAVACQYCDNGVCDKNKGEDCSICASDCGTCYTCGDAVCDDKLGENCRNCAVDCAVCPVVPAQPAGSASLPTFRPKTQDANACAGTPRVDGTIMPAIPQLHGTKESPNMFGQKVSSDIQVMSTWTQGYANHACFWTGDSGAEFEQCVASACMGIEASFKVHCTSPPLCTMDRGNVCDLDDPHHASTCDTEFDATGTISRKIGWKRDFGPFFAELEVQGGVYASFNQTTRSGAQFACLKNGAAVAGQYGSMGLTMGFVAKATASLGAELCGQRFAVSAEARACFGVTATQEDYGCATPDSQLTRGAELEIQLPKVGVGYFSWGGYTKSWKVEDGCF